MLYRLTSLFVIKTRFQAFAIIYGIALGAVERGQHYLAQYPGFGGKLLFGACCLAVFMAGGKIIDGVHATRQAEKPKAKKAKAAAAKLLPMDAPKRRMI